MRENETMRITVSEAARLLTVTPPTIRRLIQRGRIIALRVGSKFMIAQSEIEKYIAANTSPRDEQS